MNMIEFYSHTCTQLKRVLSKQQIYYIVGIQNTRFKKDSFFEYPQQLFGLSSILYGVMAYEFLRQYFIQHKHLMRIY